MGHEPEQRRHPRIDVRQRVWCEGDNLSLYVQARNMSLGGAFIQSANMRTAAWGQQDVFSLSFSHLEEAIRMRVQVVWEQTDPGSAGMGVRIMSFDEGKASYERFLDQAEGSPQQDR